MESLPLNALRAFAAVYESGGIRPAARVLRVAHSAVSRHLRELEAWLGVPLVAPGRDTRRLVFTAEGEVLGRAALASLRDLESAVAGIREAKRGNAVTVATTPSFAARWLLPRLSALATALPWVEVSVIVDQRPLDLAGQRADVAIRMGRGPWPGVMCEPLMADLLYPVMSPAFWEAQGRPRQVDSLAKLALLHDRDPVAAWAVWKKEQGPAHLDVRRGARFTSSDLVLRAAVQGLGVALARDRLARDDIASGALIRPFGDRQVSFPDAYWLVRAPAPPPRATAAALTAWLKAEAVES